MSNCLSRVSLYVLSSKVAHLTFRVWLVKIRSTFVLLTLSIYHSEIEIKMSTRQKIKNIGESIRRAPSTASRKFSRQGRVNTDNDEGRMRNRSGSQLEVNYKHSFSHFWLSISLMDCRL